MMTPDLLVLTWRFRWLATHDEGKAAREEKGDHRQADGRGAVATIPLTFTVGHLDFLGARPVYASVCAAVLGTGAHNPPVFLDLLTHLAAQGSIHIFWYVLLQTNFIAVYQKFVSIHWVSTFFTVIVCPRVANMTLQCLAVLYTKYQHQSKESEGNLERIHG